jgi:hypothetical protein
MAYNALATIYLACLGVGGRFVGILLWPAVALHLILTVLFGYAWLAQHGPNNRDLAQANDPTRSRSS